MTLKTMSDTENTPVIISHNGGASGVVVVCEHASNAIPDKYAGLGLDDAARHSHIAWDPGALGVATRLSELLDAPLVVGGVSRLIYDCNRPPEAPGAMPARSEVFEIPGNVEITKQEKATRVADVYDPFTAALSETLTTAQARVMITIHSFTRVYNGTPRWVEIGVLHDADARLADAILERATAHTSFITRRNEPYGPQDGVTHTLKEHGIKRGLLNVMLEVRNDLIATRQQQTAVADMLAPLLRESVMAAQTVQA